MSYHASGMFIQSYGYKESECEDSNLSQTTQGNECYCSLQKELATIPEHSKTKVTQVNTKNYYQIFDNSNKYFEPETSHKRQRNTKKITESDVLKHLK